MKPWAKLLMSLKITLVINIVCLFLKKKKKTFKGLETKFDSIPKLMSFVVIVNIILSIYVSSSANAEVAVSRNF